MTLTIIPRSVIGCAEPPATRPKLRSSIDNVLVHYTGSPGYNDPNKDLLYARSVAAYGANAGKSWEYNYLIGLGGTVFEQAGGYVGAHCKNFNPDSYGVLFMLGVGVQPSIIQIASFHDLRAYLVKVRGVDPDHVVSPHYRFRATACPGATLAEAPHGKNPTSPTGEGSLGQLIPALTIEWRPPIETIPPVLPIVPTEESMLALDWSNPTEVTVFTYTGAHLAWVNSGAANQVVKAGGVKRVTISDDQLLAIIRSTDQTTGPPATLTPDMLKAWAEV